MVKMKMFFPFTALSGHFWRKKSCRKWNLLDRSKANRIFGSTRIKDRRWHHLCSKSCLQTRWRNGTGEKLTAAQGKKNIQSYWLSDNTCCWKPLEAHRLRAQRSKWEWAEEWKRRSCFREWRSHFHLELWCIFWQQCYVWLNLCSLLKNFHD